MPGLGQPAPQALMALGRVKRASVVLSDYIDHLLQPQSFTTCTPMSMPSTMRSRSRPAFADWTDRFAERQSTPIPARS
jgi:hypothetical protein